MGWFKDHILLNPIFNPIGGAFYLNANQHTVSNQNDALDQQSDIINEQNSTIQSLYDAVFSGQTVAAKQARSKIIVLIVAGIAAIILFWKPIKKIFKK